jgi:cysteine desulfurase/selenocysteine lyase
MSDLPPLPADFDAAREFPILKHWLFFNHAAVAPLTARAAEVIEQYAKEAREDAYLSGDWYARADHARKLAAQLINARPDELAFVKNTSEGLAFVANGLTWKSGDEIITSAVEYPANIYPWMDVAQRFGARHVMVAERDGRVPTEDVLGAVTPRTRLIALSHVQYASGFRSELAQIGALCRERGILFCVDAIQSMGVLPVDVQGMKIDFLSADGHKWMLAPEGCGVFYCRRELLGQLRPEVGWMNVINAADYGNYDFTLRSDAKRFECGSYNIPGILAFGESLRLLLNVGIETISRRVLGLTDSLCEGLRRKGYTIVSSRRPGEASGIVAFTHPSRNHAEIVNALKAKKIIIIQREKRLRASPHFYNSQEQVDQLIDNL